MEGSLLDFLLVLLHRLLQVLDYLILKVGVHVGGAKGAVLAVDFGRSAEGTGLRWTICGRPVAIAGT